MRLLHWGHYVDDHFVIHNDEKFIHELEPIIMETFEEKIHVKVHPRKIHYTPADGANLFLGAYMMPYYNQPRQRTVNKFIAEARSLEYYLLFHQPTIDELESISRTINSYCGIFSHYKAYNLRKKFLDVPDFTKYFDLYG